jgi:DnaJ-class molecular chaperone
MSRKADLELMGLRTDDPTTDDLRTTYRTLALKLHPDTPTGDRNRFQAVSEAYRRLLTEAQKPRPCAHCDGRGWRPIGVGFNALKSTCVECGGSGKIIV